MKIAIYTPYLDTFGGGEKYMLSIAEFLSNHHQVDFLLGTHLYDLDIESTKQKVFKLHNINLTKVNFIKSPIGQGSNSISRLKFFKKYDFLFYLSDGSIFYSTAKNSIIHLQSPIKNSANLTPKGRVKLSSWKLIMYNSKFTMENAEKFWPKKSIVVYPPVDVENFKNLPKQKFIISVGRFAAHTKSKKHEILIEGFKKLTKEKNMKDWNLHLVGGILEGHESYLEDLKKLAKGFNIFFHTNLEYSELIKLYGQSQIYWHAAGYGATNPENMEHFGITTVEAMASGCVPVVINLGGQKEIVDNQENGSLWNTPEEMVEETLKILSNNKLLGKLSRAALEKSQKFNKESFYQAIEKLIS